MPEDPERVVREVTFAVEGDGRTIEARIVPYNTPTQVVDHPRNGGTGIPYVERWLPGAFEKQERAADKVLLNFEHEGGLRGVVGHGTALREAPDALYGTFRVHPGPDGDKALHMVNEGVLNGLSIEAIPTRTERSRDGIVDRIKARLDKVSLCRQGAYSEAQVLAVRESPPEDPEPDPAPPQPEPDSDKANEVDAVLRSVGYEPLVRQGISKRPWSPARARFTDEQWEDSCLVRDRLPVLEPNGDVSVEALHRAAKGISGLAQDERPAAARKLIRYYRLARQDPPAALRSLASR